MFAFLGGDTRFGVSPGVTAKTILLGQSVYNLSPSPTRLPARNQMNIGTKAST